MRRGRQYEALEAALSSIQSGPLSACLPWAGRIDRSGYGRFGGGLAHRHIYQQIVGPIPAGMDLDHLCHEPAECSLGVACPHRRCVNPRHLFPATRLANGLRSNSVTVLNAAKSECLRGHEFTEANTYITAVGSRRCRACAAMHTRAYKGRRSIPC